MQVQINGVPVPQNTDVRIEGDRKALEFLAKCFNSVIDNGVREGRFIVDVSPRFCAVQANEEHPQMGIVSQAQPAARTATEEFLHRQTAPGRLDALRQMERNSAGFGAYLLRGVMESLGSNRRFQGLLQKAAQEACAESVTARDTHGPFRSPHEGLAVLWEEFEELKAEVFLQRPSPETLRKEARSVAAMALAFMVYTELNATSRHQDAAECEEVDCCADNS